MKLDTLEVSREELSSDFFQQHKNLKKLSLIHCHNTNDLLSEIGQLQNLQELIINDHNLTALPAEIGQLVNLQKLHLHGREYLKNITVLPPDIGRLQNLQELILNEINVRELPVEIGQLQNLKILAIKGTLITTLPSEIGQLKNLQELYLYRLNITALPAEISRLENLQALALLDLKPLVLLENKLTALLLELGRLQNLQWLDLGYNLLTALPPEIGQLKNLQEINIECNRLTELPSEIAELQSLEKISLLDNATQDFSALAPLANHPNQNLQVSFFGSPEFPIEIPRKYWTALSEWKAEWLLTENNAEIRRILIQKIGYARICEELKTVELDSWREYTLLQIDVRADMVPIHLLKMTCPSTNHIHVLRVPPHLTSARKAIRWVNWDIDPESFAVET